MSGFLGPVAQKITSLLGMTTLGQKAKAAALGVTLASDEDVVKAEDAAHSSGDKGVMALAIKLASPAATAGSDGDYNPLAVDANGRLYANVHSALGVTAKGQAAMADSLPMVLASDQSAIPVTAAQLPAALGQANMAGSTSVAIASNQSAVPVSAAQLPAALGQANAAGSTSVVMASDKMITVGERLYKIEIAGTTVNVDTTIYAAGQGQGDLVEILAGWTALNSATLKSLIVLDSSAQAAAFDVVIFDDDPTLSTFENHVAAGLHVDDMPKVLGVIEVGTSDYVTFTSMADGNKSVATLKPDLPLIPASGGTLHLACVARGTPTYVADTLAITLVVQFNNDAAAPSPE